MGLYIASFYMPAAYYDGGKVLHGYTEDSSVLRSIRAQVCDVNKPLLSVSKLVSAGNTVVFAPDGAYISDQHSGNRIWLQESGGMYMTRLWVPTTPASEPGF